MRRQKHCSAIRLALLAVCWFVVPLRLLRTLVSLSARANPLAYVVNRDSNSVAVIDTATNIPLTTITAGISPFAIAITPDGKRAYFPNFGSFL